MQEGDNLDILHGAPENCAETHHAPVLRALFKDRRIVRRSGSTPIYFSAFAQFTSLEEPVAPAGNEIFVRRNYYKLSSRPTLLKGFVYDRIPLNDNETVRSGERVECILTIEAKNNYEYLVFEDLKPAGFEAVALRSGESLHARELKSDSFDKVGKPADEAQAEVMLRRLAGHRHEVLTAYRIRLGERMVERLVTTFVSFRSIDAKELAAYLASGEWRGKAGAYAIQGIAGCFVTDVRGSFTNVVGLPVAEVIADLRALEALPSYPPLAFGVSP